MRKVRLVLLTTFFLPLAAFATGNNDPKPSHPPHGKPPHHRPPENRPPSHNTPAPVMHQTQTTQVHAQGGNAHVGNVTATGGAGGNASLAIGNGALSPSASATGGSVVNSGNSSASAVIAPGAVQNRNENTNTNNVNVNARSGDSTSSAAVGDITNEVNIAAPRAIAPAAELPQVAPQTPLVPYQLGRPANVAGIEVSEVFDLLCKGIVSATDLSPVIGEGRAGKTTHVFVPHPNYAAYGKRGVRPRIELAHIKNIGSEKRGQCVCLGILQAEAIEKHASVVNRPLLQHQAMVFAAEELDGFDSILLVDARAALSVNFGQGALGSGFGVGPGLSNPFGAALATLGLNLSDTKGHTFGKAQLGNTYIVLANVPAAEIPSGAATLDPGEFQSELAKALAGREAHMKHHDHNK